MNVLITGFSAVVAGLCIVGALLHLAGRPTVIGPGAGQPPAVAWANLLLGVAIGLFTADRVPHSHRLLWDGVLLPPSLLCLLAGAYLALHARRTA